MTNTDPKTSIALPSVPDNAKDRVAQTEPKIQYTLHYREGTNPHPQFTFFQWPSADMRIVVERAKRFCDSMGYRFVTVRASLIDLNEVERKRRDQEGLI